MDEKPETELEQIRQALGGYPDSDLVSLAHTIRQQADCWAGAVERMARHAIQSGVVFEPTLVQFDNPLGYMGRLLGETEEAI